MKVHALKRLAIVLAAAVLSGCFAYTLPEYDAPADEGIDAPDADLDVEAQGDGDLEPEIAPEPVDFVDGDEGGGEDAVEPEGEPPDVTDEEEGETSACGNGVVEPPDEECDGDPDGTCLSPCRTTGARRCMGCRWVCTPPPDDNCNGIDDDCDGVCDEGYFTTATCGSGPCERYYECNCGSETCRPGTPLSPTDANCNGVDDDCDGSADEEHVPYACGLGVCAALSTCSAGVEFCAPGPPEGADNDCDRIDEDCDGAADDDYVPFACGLGACRALSTCVEGSESCTPGVPAGPDDNCNGLDENCDGAADEGYIPVPCGVGECRTLSVCEDGVEGCHPLPSQPETCGNGLDEDCNGVPDNGCVGVAPGPGSLLINEFLVDPAMDLAGDANCDGVRSATDDEFVEIVNISADLLSLDGIRVSDSVGVRHTFPTGRTLAAGKAIVVFGGGALSCSWPRDVQVFTSSTGQLGLSNSGDTITISDASANVIVGTTYGTSADNDQSLTLNPDLDDHDPLPASVTGFELHTAADAVDGSRFSPGTRINGAPF